MRALLLLAAVAEVAVAAPTRTVDWTRVTSRTPEGNFVQGNPNARVKLAETLSLACPHCAAFEKEAIDPLTAGYIRTGKVRYEVRMAFTSPFDLPVTLLARCAGPAGFFRVAPALYAGQQAWEEQGYNWAQTTKPNLDAMKPGDAFAAIAKGAGLDAFFRAHGLDDKRQAICLSDEAEARRLAAANDAIWKQPNFPGTPAFEINGARADDVHTWPQLQARLDAALK